VGEAKRRGSAQQRLEQALEERRVRDDAERERQHQARLEKARHEQQLFDADEAQYGTEEAVQRQERRKRKRLDQQMAVAQLAGMMIGALAPPTIPSSSPSPFDDPTLPF